MEALNSLSVKAVANWFASTLHPINASIRHLTEKRVFKPAKDLSKKARIKSLAQYRKMYRESMRRPDAFWVREAKELVWRKPWKRVLDWKAPFAKWFVGGQLNLSENCLDRHLDGPRRNKAAIIWEGEPGEKR